MKIDGQPVPESVLEVYRQWVREAPAEAVLTFAREEPAVAAGFRPGPKAVPAIRRRIQARLNETGDAHGFLPTFLRLASDAFEVLGLFSEVVVCAEWNLFVSLFPDEWLAAALLDERAPVRAYARGALAEPFKPVPVLDAASFLIDMLAPLVQRFPPLPRPKTPAGEEQETQPAEPDSEDHAATSVMAALEDENERLLNTVHDLEGRIEEAKVSSGKLRRVEQKLAEERERLSALQAKRADEAALHAESEKDRAALRAKVEDLSLRLRDEQKTRESVAERLAGQHLLDLRNRWLLPLREAERADSKSARSAADALTLAEEALKRQAETDRHAGNLARIRERLAQCEGALSRVRRAAAEAVSPLPLLRDAAAALEREIAALRSVAGPDAEAAGPPVIAAMVAAIHSTPAENLGGLLALLGQMEEHSLLPPNDLRPLFRALDGRMREAYSRAAPKVVAGPETRDPLAWLRGAVHGGGGFVLFVDGHNVLFNLAGVFSPFFEDGHPGARARLRLRDLLREMFQGRTECEVRLYFDGPDQDRFPVTGNMVVVYSGGSGEHRADRVIVEDVKAQSRRRPDLQLFVVTDDRALRAECRKAGAAYIAVARFGAVL